MVIDISMEMYILCYQAVKIHFVWLRLLILSELDDCKSTLHILYVGRLT